jgi:hypothetical protein
VNNPWRRYCGGCGSKLQPACTGCGFVNSKTDRFCGGCGDAVIARKVASAPTSQTMQIDIDKDIVGES